MSSSPERMAGKLDRYRDLTRNLLRAASVIVLFVLGFVHRITNRAGRRVEGSAPGVMLSSPILRMRGLSRSLFEPCFEVGLVYDKTNPVGLVQETPKPKHQSQRMAERDMRAPSPGRDHAMRQPALLIREEVVEVRDVRGLASEAVNAIVPAREICVLLGHRGHAVRQSPALTQIGYLCL